jgi:hypothetical protein
LVERLKEDKSVEVIKESFEKITRENRIFSSVLIVELKFYDFSSYVRAAICYSPSAIEITAPKKLTLDRKEFLSAIGEIIRVSRDFYEKYDITFKFPETQIEAGLTQNEIEELQEKGAIRAKIVVEGKGKTRKEAVKKFLRSVGEDLFINKIKSKKVESELPFKGVIGIEAFVPDAKTLVDIALKHTPVLVEIIGPEEIELSMLDIQDIGLELSSVFFELAYALSK